MQLPGDFLVTLTREETKTVLECRLRLFVESYLYKTNTFTQNSFNAVFHTLVMEPRYKEEMQKTFNQFLNNGIIENVPEDPMRFRFKTRPTIEKDKSVILETQLAL